LTAWERRDDFAVAVDTVVAAYRDGGYTVEITQRFDTFARLAVTDPAQPEHLYKVELAANWRALPPVMMDVGPVLHADDARNDQICRDVHAALARGRNCLVLTRQTAHVEALAQRMRDLGHEPHLLYATRKAKDLKQVLAFLADPPADGPPLLVVATDKYVGWILRNHPGKTTVEVHDYVDPAVGVLAAMWRKRARSYTQLGFAIVDASGR
jgi:hypothetical protein